MLNFKRYFTEAKIPQGWRKSGGTLGYNLSDISDSKKLQAIKSLVTSLFGFARASGVGNANTNAIVNPNKIMEFNYGFSNMMLESYFKLNGKELTKLSDFINVFIKKSFTKDEYTYVVPFGQTGYLISFTDNDDFSYYASSRELMADFDDFDETDLKSIDKLK